MICELKTIAMKDYLLKPYKSFVYKINYYEVNRNTQPIRLAYSFATTMAALGTDGFHF